VELVGGCPGAKHANVYASAAAAVSDAPVVQYRGIFLNDEAPALTGWVQQRYGGFNHQFYEKVFELILRMRGNYLWPAMWGEAFYDDYPDAPLLRLSHVDGEPDVRELLRVR